MNPPVLKVHAAVFYCGRRDIRFGRVAAVSLCYRGDFGIKPLWQMGC
jgi:hypothetical protein